MNDKNSHRKILNKGNILAERNEKECARKLLKIISLRYFFLTVIKQSLSHIHIICSQLKCCVFALRGNTRISKAEIFFFSHEIYDFRYSCKPPVNIIRFYGFNKLSQLFYASSNVWLYLISHRYGHRKYRIHKK